MAEARYTIAADDKTDRAIRSVRSNMQRLKKELFSLRTATVALAGAAAMGAVIKKATEFGNSIDKAAETAAIGSEEIQELRFAFGQLAEVTDKEVDTALQRFNRRLGLASEGGGAAKDTFGELNVELTDTSGRVRDTSVVLDEAMVALAGIESDSRRAAKASELFGEESGPKLAAALEGGIGNMEAMRSKARELGIVLDSELTDKAAELNDKFDVMKRQISAEFAETVLSNADAISELADATRTLIGWIGDGAGAITNFVSSIGEDLAVAVHGVASDDIPRLKEQLQGVESQLERLREARGPGRQDLIQLFGSEEELARQAEQLRSQIEFAEQLNESAEKRREQNEAVKKSTEEVEAAAKKAGAAMAQLFAGPREAGDMTIDQMEMMQNRITAGEAFDQEMELQRAKLQAIQQSQAHQIELEQVHFEREQEFLATAHETLFENELERKLMLETLERQHQNRLFEIQAQGQGALLQNMVQFLGSMEKAQQASGATQIGIMTNAFAQITSAGAQHSKEMFELNKAAGIANAVVSTYQAVMKTWAQWGYPWGIPFAAAQLAVGFSAVNAIKSQSFTGGGGAAPSSSAGGGVPAVQNVGNQGQQQAQQAPVQHLSVTVHARGKRTFTGEEVEDMINGIFDEAKDGNVKLRQLNIV